MNRQDFEKEHSARWQSFDNALKALEKNEDLVSPALLPRMFRRVCHDLSLSRHRLYGQRISDYLNALAIRGFKLLHEPRQMSGERLVNFFARDFPRALRADWRLFVLSSLVFWLPFFLVLASGHYEIAWVQSLLGVDGMRQMDGMYGKGENTMAYLRAEHGSNFMMFAHYIQNNVGIDFQLYAGGVLFGIGSLFFLLFNGLSIGAAAGYVQYAGDPQKFYTFVAGHSSFELLGMIVVGMAGLKLGLALLAPGQRSRGAAAAEAGRAGLPLLLGGAAMTAAAAVVEGFWSAQDLAPGLKYGVGAFFWLAHLFYFTFAGRGARGA